MKIDGSKCQQDKLISVGDGGTNRDKWKLATIIENNIYDTSCGGNGGYYNGFYMENNAHANLIIENNTFVEYPHIEYDSTTTLTFKKIAILSNVTIRDYATRVYISVNGRDDIDDSDNSGEYDILESFSIDINDRCHYKLQQNYTIIGDGAGTK